MPVAHNMTPTRRPPRSTTTRLAYELGVAVRERLAHALDVDLAVQFKPRTSADQPRHPRASTQAKPGTIGHIADERAGLRWTRR
jgi:hypothetical protein